jgi:Fur family transcriptional regulator, iron response regulator
MDKKKDIIDKLRSTGLRPTKQRVRLAEYLFNRSKTFHFSVENLDKIINKKGSEEKVALATIYNTVNAFKKKGHLKEILLKEGRSYFDTNTTSHHHFYDADTNELTDIHFNEIEVTKLPHPPKGKKIKDLEVVIGLKKI